MRSKYNPIQTMLDNYNSNIQKEKAINNSTKLKCFIKSIIDLMYLKGYELKYQSVDNNTIDVYIGNTLLVTYNSDIFNSVKTETSLKFQFLLEWGMLLENLSKYNVVGQQQLCI